MKGITTRVKSHANLSGAIKIDTSNSYAKGLTIERLRKEYPECDQRAFGGIIDWLTSNEDKIVKVEAFREAVRMAMYEVVKLIHPNTSLALSTNFNVLYEIVMDFIKDRDAKIAAYQRNKK